MKKIAKSVMMLAVAAACVSFASCCGNAGAEKAAADSIAAAAAADSIAQAEAEAAAAAAAAENDSTATEEVAADAE